MYLFVSNTFYQFNEKLNTIILKKNECKFVVKEKKTFKFTTDNIEIFSDDSNRENSDEEIPMKKIKYKLFFEKI